MNRKMRNILSLGVLLLLTGLACSFISGATSSPTIPSAQAAPKGHTQQLHRDFSFALPLFSAQSAWNQSIVGAALVAENDQQILTTYRVLRGDTRALHPSWFPPTTWPFMDINYDEYAVPVFRMGSNNQSVLICDYEGYLGWPSPKFPDAQQEGGPVTVPGPEGTVRPAGPQDTDADGHLVLYNPSTYMAYDFWQATTRRNDECDSLGGGQPGDQILEAGAVDFFDMRADGSNIDTYSSARATGVPLLGGLILPEDIANGKIAHALAVAIPGLRNLSEDPSEPLPPILSTDSCTTETDFYNDDEFSLAAGQRLRLRSTLVDEEGSPINENQLAPITQIFLAALRTYGAIVVDNAGGFSYYAEDIHSANLDLSIEQINTLIGEPAGTPLPPDKTQWQVVIEKLNLDLEMIPFAYGPWNDGDDPTKATIAIPNFEIVDPDSLTEYTSQTYLPVITNTPAPSVVQPSALNEVAYWAYQLQGISKPGAVDTLVNSHYDMLVLEPTRTDWSSSNRSFDTRGMVTSLKNSLASDGLHRKLVLAYIDIGEAEDWRWYWDWSTGWDCTGPRPPDWPDYILTCDPDGWAGNYPVAYWDTRWQDIIIYGQNQDSDPYGDYTSAIDETIKDGFDGIYLDWVEAFEDETVIAAAQAAGLDPAEEMLTFINSMRTYAAARNPNFLIIQQNAASLIELAPGLENTINAIAQEAIWYDGDATDNWDDLDGYDWENDPDLTMYYLDYLDEYLAAGLPVFDCEYALDEAGQAYANAYNEGFVPYVTRRSLSQLTTTPPPDYR